VTIRRPTDDDVPPTPDRDGGEDATPSARAAEVLAGADAVLATAGAGIGVDSGLPDFRGDEGFWRAYPPYARLGLSFVQLANPAVFTRDPELAWGFYGHRRALYRRTVPHAGFAVLRDLAGFVFTSNVDGQFQAAGFDPTGSSSATGPCGGTSASPAAARRRSPPATPTSRWTTTRCGRSRRCRRARRAAGSRDRTC
jgi:hypothetical protein